MTHSPYVIQTRSGRLVDPGNLSVYDIDPRDVAHALAQQSRYAGHTVGFISVAEHCCRVHDWLKDKGHNARTCAYGLWHDAHEAYTVDIPSPFKKRLTEYKQYADNAKTICDHWLGANITLLEGPVSMGSVTEVDKNHPLYEALAGWPEGPLHPIWEDKFGKVVPEDVPILTPEFWEPYRAKGEFIARLSLYLDHVAGGRGF